MEILFDIRHSSGRNNKASVKLAAAAAICQQTCAASSLPDCCANASGSSTFGELRCSLFSFMWSCPLLHVRGATRCHYHHLDGTEPNQR